MASSDTPSISLTQGEVLPHCNVPWKHVWDSKWGNFRTLLVCFSFLRDHWLLFSDAHNLIYCFIYLAHFLVVSGRTLNIVFLTKWKSIRYIFLFFLLFKISIVKENILTNYRTCFTFIVQWLLTNKQSCNHHRNQDALMPKSFLMFLSNWSPPITPGNHWSDFYFFFNFSRIAYKME